jgi:hypothetical protein
MRRDLDGPLLVDRELRTRAASRALALAAGSRRLRRGPLIHAARLDVRSTRTALQSGDFIPQRRHHSLQLDQFFPLPDNQALQLGVRQTVKIIGRRHTQNESDSRPPVNRIIIPPRVLPLLRISVKVVIGFSDRSASRNQSFEAIGRLAARSIRRTRQADSRNSKRETFRGLYSDWIHWAVR